MGPTRDAREWGGDVDRGCKQHLVFGAEVFPSRVFPSWCARTISRLRMRTDTKQKTTLNAHTFGTVGKTREPRKVALSNAPKCVIFARAREKHEQSRERISIGATHYARPRARSSHAADAFRAVRTRDPANMSSAAFASTSRLSHTARIGSSRRADAPLRSFRSSGVAARHGCRATRVVAAVAEPGTVAAPLTKEDLVDYLRSGCKPKEQWRCVRGRLRSTPHDVASGFSAPFGNRSRDAFPVASFRKRDPAALFSEQIKPRNRCFSLSPKDDASSRRRDAPSRLGRAFFFRRRDLTRSGRALRTRR